MTITSPKNKRRDIMNCGKLDETVFQLPLILSDWPTVTSSWRETVQNAIQLWNQSNTEYSVEIQTTQFLERNCWWTVLTQHKSFKLVTDRVNCAVNVSFLSLGLLTVSEVDFKIIEAKTKQRSGWWRYY